MKYINLVDLETKMANELNISTKYVSVVGSTLILMREGNDIDFLVYMPAVDYLERFGFTPDLKEKLYSSAFSSWRRDSVNIIAVDEFETFMMEVTIAHAARRAVQMGLDLSDRQMRISFHSDIRKAVGFYANRNTIHG